MSTWAKWMIVPLLWSPLAALATGIDFTLKDMQGRERNVREFIGQGKWTVVVVWESSCSICHQEIHQMSFFHEAHKNKDAIVLGISIDGQAGRQQALGFIKEHRLGFTNLLAELPQIQQFGGGPFMGTPTFYIYSPKGRLRAYQAGSVSQEQIEQYMAKGARDPG
jgi:peroxiredoxin